MNSTHFENIFEDRVAKTRDLLINKAKEYADDSDRLHNFKSGASITGKSAAEVLDGFLLKHYISYRDMLNAMAKGERVSPDKFEEKIGDIITYFFLQEAVMRDSGLIDYEQKTVSHAQCLSSTPQTPKFEPPITKEYIEMLTLEIDNLKTVIHKLQDENRHLVTTLNNYNYPF